MIVIATNCESGSHMFHFVEWDNSYDTEIPYNESNWAGINALLVGINNNSNFKTGDYILYNAGHNYEIGVIRRIRGIQAQVAVFTNKYMKIKLRWCFIDNMIEMMAFNALKMSKYKTNFNNFQFIFCNIRNEQSVPFINVSPTLHYKHNQHKKYPSNELLFMRNLKVEYDPIPQLQSIQFRYNVKFIQKRIKIRKLLGNPYNGYISPLHVENSRQAQQLIDIGYLYVTTKAKKHVTGQPDNEFNGELTVLSLTVKVCLFDQKGRDLKTMYFNKLQY